MVRGVVRGGRNRLTCASQPDLGKASIGKLDRRDWRRTKAIALRAGSIVICGWHCMADLLFPLLSFLALVEP